MDESNFGGYVAGLCVGIQGSWVQYILLIEFTYNNSYQETIGMLPYEALYGRKC
jgi:hypothetical protein